MAYAQRASLDCLEYLCDVYDKLPDSSRKEITWSSYGSPLIEIVKGCNWAAIRIVEKHRDFMNNLVDEPFDDNANTPMLIAVRENYIEIAKWLINLPGKNPDIEKKNVKGESPIYLVALKGQVEVIKDMLIFLYVRKNI
jgi:ankyrin repeat protein